MIIAGIKDLEVTAVVIDVRAIEDIIKMLLIIPSPLIVPTLYFEVETCLYFKFVNPHEFFLISFPAISLIF